MFKKLRGVIGTLFKIGVSASAPQLKNNSNVLEIRDGSDSDFGIVRVARPAGDLQAASTFRDVKERTVLIEFSFDGASAPSAGTNSGKYGFVHTTGGSYSAGQVVYDNGTSIETVSIYKMQTVHTTTSISGTVSLIGNGIYIAQSGSAPYSWTLKGDGTPSNTGVERHISIAVGTDATTDSTTSIPSGAVVQDVVLDVDTAYDAGTTIQVAVNGSSPLEVMATTDNNAEETNQFSVEQVSNVSASNAGTVRVTITGTPAAGASVVIVKYVEAYLS
jgi:hypothetical protein